MFIYDIAGKCTSTFKVSIIGTSTILIIMHETLTTNGLMIRFIVLGWIRKKVVSTGMDEQIDHATPTTLTTQTAHL